jgi:hypothetical protein
MASHSVELEAAKSGHNNYKERKPWFTKPDYGDKKWYADDSSDNSLSEHCLSPGSNA